MTTKVAGNADETPELRRRLAAGLGFLVGAQRGKGVTLQSVAVKYETQRSNLSAYIRSLGERKNINSAKLREVLHHVGLHWDLTLVGRLHRWDLGSDLELLDGFAEIMASNPATCVRMMATTGCRESFLLFLLEGDAAVCIVRLEKFLFDGACEAVGIVEDMSAVSRVDSDAVQSAWLTKDDVDAERRIRLLIAEGGRQTNSMALTNERENDDETQTRRNPAIQLTA